MGDGQRRIVMVEFIVGDALFRLNTNQFSAMEGLFFIGERKVVRQDEDSVGF